MKTAFKYLLILLIITLFRNFLGSEVLPVVSKSAVSVTNPPFFTSDSVWVEKTLTSLTPDEKIGQMIMVAAFSNLGDDHSNQILKLIKQYKPGGIIFMQGSPVKQAILTNRFQVVSKTPLLIALDAERGLGMRLDSATEFPRQMMLGAITNDSLIYGMGAEIARQCRLLGVQVNFAPVIDVNNNPANPVIGTRSFGEDKINVASKGHAYMKGLQDCHVLAVGKHFPGHGDTDSDSHITLPVVYHPASCLDTLELYPFRQLIDSGLGSIMIAHLYVPAYDTTRRMAASLSPKIVTGLLKEAMKFKGLIFTDALNMKGVTDYYDNRTLVVKALLAGNDILLCPEDIPGAIEQIKKAVESGDISMNEIDARCRKILKIKSWAGLNRYKPVDIEKVKSELTTPHTQVINRRLIESSLTLLKNDGNLVPFPEPENFKIASIVVGTDDINTFQTTLSLYADIKHFNICKEAYSDAFEAMMDTLSQYNLVIAGIHNTDVNPANNFGITDNTIDFISRLAERTQVVLNIFAPPYCLQEFRNLDNVKVILMSFEDNPVVQDLSAQLLFGGIPALGKLPVTAAPGFPVGCGIILQKQLRFKYTLPEDLNIDSRKLARIDSIVNDAIKEKAIPGCQILAAKNGVVFYRKSFGYHTYENKTAVTNTDIYDLASISKIAATTLSLMKLFEEGKFDPEKKIAEYLPYLDTTNKKDMVIKDILTHQAQLTPWIPFYLKTLDEKKNLRTDIYCRTYSDEFPVKVADSIYIKNEYRDTMYMRIASSKLLEKKEYKYSDLGFYLFHRVVENLSGMKLDEFASKSFYKPLGAVTLGYRPLDRFARERMVPTQLDVNFRKQLIQGYVHDPGAAMIGGVAGHAGVFSNANDLAKLMQMMLAKGEYGGRRYFKPETIELFTSCPNGTTGNRRGLGFDKPEQEKNKPNPVCKDASPKSFGHTGFTGTIAWADPENQLVYIFLSNRICPDQENKKLIKMDVREKIQSVFYNAVK